MKKNKRMKMMSGKDAVEIAGNRFPRFLENLDMMLSLRFEM
jgi:hypothetical protein